MRCPLKILFVSSLCADPRPTGPKEVNDVWMVLWNTADSAVGDEGDDEVASNDGVELTLPLGFHDTRACMHGTVDPST